MTALLFQFSSQLGY